MEFNKKPLNTAEMVQRLISRGMKIEDINQTEHVLKHINYNRLSPYWRTFELDHSNDDHTFRVGTNLDYVLRIYAFDGELRLLLMAEIERIEISLRRGWAGHLSIRYGAFAHQDALLFGKNWMWLKSLEKLKEDYRRSDEPFATHHLVIVRNIVAHHSRIWNRRFVFKFKFPKNKFLGLWDLFNHGEDDDKKLYNTLVMLGYFSKRIDSSSTFIKKIVDLLDRYPEIVPSAMGFPANWKEMDFWL